MCQKIGIPRRVLGGFFNKNKNTRGCYPLDNRRQCCQSSHLSRGQLTTRSFEFIRRSKAPDAALLENARGNEATYGHDEFVNK